MSQYGHDFRKAYIEIGRVKKSFGVGVTAVTATANPEVKQDILKNLGMENPREFVFSSVRAGLVYSIHWKSTDPDVAFISLERILSERYVSSDGPMQVGIVFCATRAECDEIGARLISDRIDACVYHAGKSKTDRKRVVDEWSRGIGPRICIATECFGMGIDRPDVDFVVHYSLPKTLSAYHQVS